jgi:hypothetical protein
MEKLKDNVTDKVTENTVETAGENSNLQITESARKYLYGMRKWTNFLSVLYYIGTGCFVLLIFGTLFGVIKVEFILAFLIYATLLFMFGTDLHIFSKSTKSALVNNDPEEIEKAFKYLKSYWRLFGILTIISIFIMAAFILSNILSNF